MSTIDKYEFFYQASQRILGTLKLDKAIQDCLLYIRDFIPAEYFAVHFYDAGLGIFETVVDATVERSVIGSQITTLTPRARMMIEEVVELKSPGCMTFQRAIEHEMARQLGIDLKRPDSSAMAMDLVVADEWLGLVSVSQGTDVEYLPEHSELLSMLHDPLASVCSQFRRFRELENTFERELAISPKGPLTFAGFRPKIGSRDGAGVAAVEPVSMELDQMLIWHITRVLRQTKGRVEGADGAAEVLNMNPRTLQSRMKKLGIPFGRKAKDLY